ncbi:hypothetical protein Q0Z83_016190 [Actinoplanes sichuanensis]|nr:hypothetical protein Q0Z83_016190 [Actinoplanes sichuanensis]
MILGCATAATIAAAFATAVLLRDEGRSGWDHTVPAFWPLLATVLVSALILLVWPRHHRAAAVVILVCAVQLIGGGLVASRDWFQFVAPEVLRLVMPLTVLVVMAMTVVAGAALLLLFRRPAATWRPRHPGWLVIGVLVAAVLPAWWAVLSDFTEMAFTGQIALAWSLPWGACLAAGAWLAKPLRRLTALTVAAAPLVTLALLLTPMFPGTTGD